MIDLKTHPKKTCLPYFYCLPILVTAFVLNVSMAAEAQQWHSFNDTQELPVTVNFGDVPQALFRTTNSAEVTTQRSHTIRRTENGTVQGRIATIDQQDRRTKGLPNLKVYFVRSGRIAYQATTNSEGSFSLNNVASGPYSFVATGRDGFATYGIYVAERQDQNGPNMLEAAAVPANIPGLRKILSENLPLAVTDEILQNRRLNSVPATQVTGSNKVKLVRGQLTGQIFGMTSNASQSNQSVGGTMVNLIQNGRRVAEVQADESGNYAINDLQPGVYDFIAVGYHGLAAIRFEAVGQDSPMTQVSYGPVPKLIATSLDVFLTLESDSVLIDQAISNSAGPPDLKKHDSSPPIEYAAQSVGSGGAAGGSSGQAGNFSGFRNTYSTGSYYGGGGRYIRRGLGGGGRLLLFGGMAGGLTAIASDPPSASPNR